MLLLLMACSRPASEVAATDLDADGFTTAEGDCDDADAQVNAAMPEAYYSGRDEDCDPATDDTDQDGDGTHLREDCDDTDAAVHPGVEDGCDGIDNDCSGLVDDG